MPTNLRPYNAEGQRHGLWIICCFNGELDYKGEFINGKRHGFHESYWNTGDLYYKGTYDMGKRIGHWIFKGEKLFYAN